MVDLQEEVIFVMLAFLTDNDFLGAVLSRITGIFSINRGIPKVKQRKAEKEKIRKVLAIYRKRFETTGITQARYKKPFVPMGRNNVFGHLYWMLDEIEKFLIEGNIEKSFRWLGFIQGALWANHEYTIKNLQNHNRP